MGDLITPNVVMLVFFGVAVAVGIVMRKNKAEKQTKDDRR